MLEWESLLGNGGGVVFCNTDKLRARIVFDLDGNREVEIRLKTKPPLWTHTNIPYNTPINEVKQTVEDIILQLEVLFSNTKENNNG